MIKLTRINAVKVLLIVISCMLKTAPLSGYVVRQMVPKLDI